MMARVGPQFGQRQSYELYFGPAVCTLMVLGAWFNYGFYNGGLLVEAVIGALAGLGFLYSVVGMICVVREVGRYASATQIINIHANTYFWELLGKGLSRCRKGEKVYVGVVLTTYVVCGVVAFVSFQSVFASINRSGAILFGTMIETLIVFLLSVVFLLVRRGSRQEGLE